MNVRVPLAILFSGVLWLLVLSDLRAAELTIQDTCGRLTEGSIDASDPASAVLTAESDGSVAVIGYTGSYTAGLGQCEERVGKPPVCSLSASHTKVNRGATLTLFAKCTKATSQVDWNVPAGSPTLDDVTPPSLFAKSVTLANPGAYTYTAVGTSSVGTGYRSNPITVLVGNEADTGVAADKPVCNFTVSPALIKASESATLSVVCQPDPTSYTWDLAEAGAPTSPSSSTGQTALTFANTGTFTYKVMGVNSTGSGPKASATVTVDPATPIALRGMASRTTAGVLNFPAGTQASDWLVLYVASRHDPGTLSGWANPRKYVWTGGAAVSSIFTRQAGTDTSVTLADASFIGGVVLAYQGGTGFGTPTAFGETTASAATCAASLTRLTAGGMVIGFFSDGDSGPPTIPTGFTSQSSFLTATYINSVSDRAYGSTGSSSASWTQTASHQYPAVCALIELKQ